MIQRLLNFFPMNSIPVFSCVERLLTSKPWSNHVVANWHVSVLSLVVVIFVPFDAVRAQQEDVVASGQQLFNEKCAVCHGLEGKGDGVLGQHLKKQPADLSRLSGENGDAFPFWLAYAKIDGRESVGEHGPSDMPVWGTDEMYTGSGGRLTMGQILAIVFFLESIQEQ